MAVYTKNDLDVKLLNNNERVEYQFEFLKHDVHENLDLNKTVESLEYLKNSQNKDFGDLMSSKDEEAGEKYRITEKIIMIMMMASLCAVAILVMVYIILQVYTMVRRKNKDIIKAKLNFIFKITLTFIVLLLILYLIHKGIFYINNKIKVSRKFLHRV